MKEHRPRVLWVTFAPLEKTPGGTTSSFASVRYRAIIPSRELGSSGFDSRITYLGAGANRRTLAARFDGADAVVFGKLLAPPDGFAREAEQVLELMAQLRARGVKLLADYSDDHFLDPARGPSYVAMANAVDAVVASTPGLAEVVRQYTNVPVTVVTDPVEGAREPVRVAGQAPYRLLWFGHPLNLDTLRDSLPQLERAAAMVPHSLLVVTAKGAGAEKLGPSRFRAWSAGAMREELQACDAVVIPSNPHDPRKSVKSPNRFTESLWAGRFVIAHALPAYEELADFGWVGEDLGEGLKWYASHPREAAERIARGQAAISARFAPAVVARAWRAAILGLT